MHPITQPSFSRQHEVAQLKESKPQGTLVYWWSDSSSKKLIVLVDAPLGLNLHGVSKQVFVQGYESILAQP